MLIYHIEQERRKMDIVCYFILLILTEGISSITVITEPELTVTLGSNTPVVLNCTYVTDKRIKTIIWKKFINHAFKDLAEFSTDGIDPVYSGGGIYLRNRSDLINPGNGSFSAVLIIKDVQCEDEGRYQCFLKYYDVALEQATSETAVFLQVSAEQPTNFKLYTSGTLKENDEVNLSCSANVGNPDGYVAIWKLNKFSNKPEFLNNSSLVDEKTENCTAVANLNITYTVSRDDNGAIFRCSSQNRQTEGPAPNKDTTAIDVQYGPSVVRIKSSPSHLNLFIGANINLTCSSDGNPAPTFKWKFNSSDVLNDERHSLIRDNRTLILRKMGLNDSGIYVCLASSLVDGETLKMSSNLSLKVQKIYIETFQPTCAESPCRIMEICSEKDGKAFCVVNHWFFPSLVFIFFTLIFMVTTVILCRRRSRHNNSSIKFNGGLKSGDHSKSQTNEYDFDGYSDPKDVTKLCQKTEKSEPEIAAYADPVDSNNQYASVQKDIQNPSNPPNVYDGAWV